MLRLVVVTGVFFNFLLLLAADEHQADDTAVTAVTWEKDFRPLYAESAYYPRATALSDGRTLVALAHPTPTGKAIACLFSSDGGKTWTNYRRISEHPRPVDLDNAFPLQLADGTVLVAYRRHDRPRHVFRLEVSSSRDGESWAVRSTIVTGTEGIWEPFLLALSEGVVQAYYASEEGCHPDQRIEVRTSVDGGKSWGTPVTVAEKKGSRDGMPGVVRLDDQELLAVFEAQDLPPFRFVIRGVRSPDLGRTWSAMRQLVYRPQHAVAAPWSAGAPSIIRLRDGRLMVSFQSDEKNAFVAGDRRRDPAQRTYNYLRHTHFACVTSLDQGRSWTAPVPLLGGPDDPANWNALYVVPDGAVFALSNYRGKIWINAGASHTSR
ncbi:MAG: hypothetical protein GX575_15730 [Candidatus Anammoximicrobium sp.]|nr:hypothetical protein [Candidatus Anammoximicrobium sp.]